MIVKLQNGDKLKMISDGKETARGKYKEYSQLSIGQKLKRNLNIASNFLKSGPNITNFGNAVSALFGGFTPENPDLTKGDPPAAGIKNFENLVRTARVAREFNDVVKGPVNQFRLLNNFIEKFITNPKGSGKLVHYDKGNGKSIYQENRGASIINGKLIPGKTKREGQKNYTWWNTDNPYINVHKAKEGPLSPTRYIVVNDNTQFKHPFDLKEPVGQSAGKGRGFILPTERVTDKPVDLTNAEIYEKSPFGWWERIKVQPTPEVAKGKPYVRWSQKGYLNEAYNIEGGPGQKFLVVKDVDNPQPLVLNTKGNGEYSLHFHSTRDNPNKEKMFQALAESIPEGGKVSTWGTISKGGYHGINRFGEQFGWPKVGERPAVNGPVNIFQKPIKNNDSKSNVYVAGDSGWKELSYPSYLNYVQNILKNKGMKIETYDRNNTNEQTRMNFFNKGFNPVFKIYPDNNLKAHSQEILRRMKNFGLDVDNTIGELPLYGKKSIKDLVTLNSGRTSYVGYYNKPGFVGTFFHNNGTSIVDPGQPIYKDFGLMSFISNRAQVNNPDPYVFQPLQSIISTMHHERNMHGTQKFLTPEMWKLYEDFLKKMFNKTNTDEFGRAIAITKDNLTLPVDKGSLMREELRATIGEMVKNLYETKAYAKLNNANVKKYDLETLRPYFEQVVDDMSDQELLELLKNINGYGEDYARLGPRENPNFYKELRNLLKVAPATLPILIPRKEEKK